MALLSSTDGSALARWLPWRRGGPVIPAIRLSGTIGGLGWRGTGLTLANLERAIARAFHKRAPAVALLVNSPGGSPVQSALIAGRIRQLADEKQRPVLAFIEDLAASGGYWLACAADELFADPASIVGSIGVVSSGFGFHEAIGRLGIERRVHTSGPRKALLDPFRPERDDDLLLLKEIQTDIHLEFQSHVKARRGARLKAEEADLFDGRIWTGRGALAAGLVDGLGDARSVLRSRFGEKTRIQVVNQPRTWFQRRLGRGVAPGGAIVEVAAAVEERLLWQRYGL
ncbi:MAG TPA: S49 family peptidase [Geminicoccaceae bacterium]|nr:S49 family peptidase [Geminicoccaceae bacterium]